MPPAASIACMTDHPAAASASVRISNAGAPAATSKLRPIPDSSINNNCDIRAKRRAASPSPLSTLWPHDAIRSAPPKAPANKAVVMRSMLVSSSNKVKIRRPGIAVMNKGYSSGFRPNASSKPAHPSRKARIFTTPANISADKPMVALKCRASTAGSGATRNRAAAAAKIRPISAAAVAPR